MISHSLSDSLRYRLRRLFAILTLVPLTGLPACSSDSPFGNGGGGGGGGGNDQSAIIVRGSILDKDGIEVFGSVVSIQVYEYSDSTCDSQPVADPVEASVNEGGGYYSYITFATGEFDACLDIEVDPPSGFQSDRRVLIDQNVNELGRDQIDEVRVDFVLERS